MDEHLISTLKLNVIREKNDERARKALFELFGALHGGTVYVPVSAVVSAADAAQGMNAVPGDAATAKDTVRLKPDILKKGDGSLYFPIFSHVDEVPEDYRQRFSILPMRYTQALATAKATAELKGLVLDGFTEPLQIPFGLADFHEAFFGKEDEKRTRPAEEQIADCQTVYVLYAQALGAHIPAVNGSGYALVFTERSYAENVVRKNGGAGLMIAQMTPEQFVDFVRSWYPLGVVKFVLNADTAYSQTVERDAYLPDPLAKGFDYLGSRLNLQIIRYRQYRENAQNESAKAGAVTFWSAICHQLPENLFLVPVCYDGDPDTVEDAILHVTERSGEAVQAHALRMQAEKTVVGEPDLYAALKIYGGEGYRLADRNDRQGDVLHIKTVTASDRAFIPAFTDMKTLQAIFGRQVRVGLFTFDELLAYTHSAVEGFDGDITGIVFNPGGTNLVLGRDDLVLLLHEKEQPTRIVVAEAQAEADAQQAKAEWLGKW